jgi:hypothetical protein
MLSTHITALCDSQSHFSSAKGFRSSSTKELSNLCDLLNYCHRV